MTYRVNEIFAGIEGEGVGVGVPTVRVRLQGCSQACKLRNVCDQAEALGAGGENLTLGGVMTRVLGFDAGTAYPFPWVAISGGEPLEQEIEPLIEALHRAGKWVRVETSGLARRLGVDVEYLRVSPKETRPRRTLIDSGAELSVVYTGREDLPAWEAWGDFRHHTLQPLTYPDGRTNVVDCLRICQERPIWRLSVQLHKLLGVL